MKKQRVSKKVAEQRTLKKLRQMAPNLGVRVSYEHIKLRLWGRQVNGYYEHHLHSPHLHRSITIHKKLFPAKEIIILAHELGHAALGHGNLYNFEDPEALLIMQEEEAWNWAEKTLKNHGYVPKIFYFQRDGHLKNLHEGCQEALKLS